MKKLLCLIFVGAFLFAADFGKIIGKVADNETGEPLAGADVLVEGTELGAATDENGEYTVLYVPVGTYQVVTGYMGYDPYTYTNVVVNADQTTLLNFRVRSTVIEVTGVTVAAERPLVIISQTQTGHAVTSKEMERLPVTTINQVITLQAGVSEDYRGTHIRGGRVDEVTYFVDGIATKIPQSGFQSVRISPSAVEEVTVVSGGFDAEYGDALSGVVNIVTKEGGTKHSGNFRYLTDEMFTGMEAINYGYNLYNLTLGGPLPVSTRLRYFLSGEVMMTDAFTEAEHFVPSPRMDYRAQARFSYHFPKAKGKITVSGFNERRQYVVWRNLYTGIRNYKYFDNIYMGRVKNLVGSVTFNYMLTEQTLASLKVGATHYERARGNRDYVWEEENDRKWYEDYRLVAEPVIDYLLQGEMPVQEALIDSLVPYHEKYQNRGEFALRNCPYAVEGLFYTYGSYRLWQYSQNDDYQGRFDITHSIGKVHELKAGLDFTQYNMKEYYNSLPAEQLPFWDYYDKNPIKVACYVQDKIDFKGLIARLGVRFDYFDAKAFTYENPTNYLDSTLLHAEANYKISPRIGFSLPVTERMKFRFNYGHYFQLPALDDIYSTTDTAVIRPNLAGGNVMLGNILMKAQKTVQYEVSIENQLSDVFAVGFTAYFKDIYDLSSSREVIALPTPYFQYENVDYGNVKGFELSLRKRMSNMWALGVSYTLQFARGTGADSYEWYSDHYNWQVLPPVLDYWLSFDERHIANTNLDLEFPDDFTFIPLQDLTTSFVFSYHSGRPYTPEDLRGNKLGEKNSARTPGYWNVDWNFNRQISIGPVNLQVNGLIYNLFNTTQIIDVYTTTGEPDDHGDPEPGLGEFTSIISILSTRYSPQGDYNHDGIITPVEQKTEYILAQTDYYTEPRHHRNPFKVRLGVGIGF